MAYDYAIFLFDTNSNLSITNISRANNISKILDKKQIHYELKKIKPTINSIKLDELDDFIKFIKNKYNKNVILIESRETPKYIDLDGTVRETVCDYDMIAIEELVTTYLLEKFDCHIIKCPYNILADKRHKWGFNNVHYVYEYYKYAFEAILTIVNNKDDLIIYKKMDLLYAKACTEMTKIYSNKIKSVDNTLKLAEHNLRIGNKDCAFKLIDELIEQNEPMAYVYMGRFYTNGLLPIDYKESVKWYRKSVSSNLNWSIELFDVLWKIGTPEAYNEMVAIAKRFAEEKNNPSAMGRLGRAYREGKGVPKDLNIAADWMMKATAIKMEWWTIELLDILWKIGTPEAYNEMVATAKRFAEEKNNPSAMARLGRAYRDGKGVPKDLNIAADWMRKATDKNPAWTKEYKELIEMIDSSK